MIQSIGSFHYAKTAILCVLLKQEGLRPLALLPFQPWGCPKPPPSPPVALSGAPPLGGWLRVPRGPWAAHPPMYHSIIERYTRGVLVDIYELTYICPLIEHHEATTKGPECAVVLRPAHRYYILLHTTRAHFRCYI